MSMIDSFGRGALGNPIDDLANTVSSKVEAQIDAWAQPRVEVYANQAYDTFRARFEKDKQVLVDEIVVAAKPGMKKAVGELIEDPGTQDKLNALEAQIGNKLAKALVVTAVTTAALTWGLVTFLPKFGRGSK
jgi:hypothetical protein